MHGSVVRHYLLVWIVAGMAMILAGCSQPLFVGFEQAPPAEVVLVPDENAPVPPFGPFAAAPDVPVAGQPPTAVVTPIPLDNSGPAFAWQETDNFLILGTDRRPSDSSWRTDTIMVVGLDRKLNRAAVLSIPRDLYLEIPNYGYGRINQVDYIGEKILKTEGGGPALVSDVLSRTLGIKTSHWVRFEMTGFIDVVDALGGVTIHLDCPFYEPIFNLTNNSWEYFTLPAGDVFMDGETAYWYVRLRLKESDIGRSQRQRQFLWAVREQVLTSNLLPRLPQLFSAFNSTFSTDLTLVEMLNWLRFGTGLDPASVRASGITLKELQSYTTEQGAAVLIINDPARVQSVVDGIWNAPAMVDARRQDAAACAPAPAGVPAVAADTSPTPVPTLAPAGDVILPEPTPAPAVEVALPEPTAAEGGS